MPSAGLLPAAVLAQRTGLAQLVDARLSLGRHGANSGTKALGVIGSMLTGADCIDDTDVLRAGAMNEVFTDTRAPSTLGTWLRDFKCHNVRQLDAVSRELLARLWQAGAGPDEPSGPLTVDLDSTIVEVFGRAKQGAGFGYTKVRGYHPRLATLAETGHVLSCRLRRGSGGAGGGRQDVPDRDNQPAAPRRSHRRGHHLCGLGVLLQGRRGHRPQAGRAVLRHRRPGQEDPRRDPGHRRGRMVADPVLALDAGGLPRRRDRDQLHLLRRGQAGHPSTAGGAPRPPDTRLAAPGRGVVSCGNNGRAVRDDQRMLRMARRIVIVSGVFGVLLVAGCSSTPPAWEGTQLDQAGWWTCDALRREASDAGGFDLAYVMPVESRGPFVRAVGAYGGDTTNAAVKEQAVGLAKAAASPAPLAWRAALNLTVAACADAGYPDLELKPGG